MLKAYKYIEFLISLEAIIISSFIPAFILLPKSIPLFSLLDIPITIQIPTIIILALTFSRSTLLKAFTAYLLIGILWLPVFYDGGSLGYIITPNFGYLLGIYPLIFIIKKFKNYEYRSLPRFLIIGLYSLLSMHFVGIIYITLQLLIYNKLNLFFYYLGKFTLGRFFYELVTLIPIYLFTRFILLRKRYSNE